MTMNILNLISRICIKALLIWSVLQTCAVFCIVQERPETDHDNTTYEADDKNPANAKQQRWAESAYMYIQNMDCSQTVFANERECELISQLTRSEINVYLADPLPYDKYRTVIPEDDLDSDSKHDAVIVIDPYPNVNFGHLVMVFYIDLYIKKDWCLQDKGTILDGGECMTLAYKRRCRDVRNKKRNYARRCKMNFIPLVYKEKEFLNPTQELTCRSNIPGFGQCPVLRSESETRGIFCKNTPNNPRHCETAAHHVHTSCRPFETCDQAVIISGGWNRWSSRTHHKDSAWAMYHMVKNHGFNDKNVKVFYANGAHGIPKDPARSDTDLHEVYPAVYKSAMRNHIQTVCSSPHCADSLLLYINGPSQADGTTFLWDADNDGVVQDEEVYKLEELLGDIANCKSKTVHLIADQSFSGEISKAVKRSKNHRNVAVYASSRENEYATSDRFTQEWTKRNHTTVCMRDVFRLAKKAIHESSPEYEQGPDVRNLNLFGAECGVSPPFSFEELHADYFGCQNVPLGEWIESQYSSQQNDAQDMTSSSERSRERRRRVRRRLS